MSDAIRDPVGELVRRAHEHSLRSKDVPLAILTRMLCEVIIKQREIAEKNLILHDFIQSEPEHPSETYIAIARQAMNNEICYGPCVACPLKINPEQCNTPWSTSYRKRTAKHWLIDHGLSVD
jgi:hypothetical protein